MSKPKIFISYAHSDQAAAKRIAAELEKVELKVWLDASSLKPGENWVSDIEKGLQEAGYLLLLLSHASLASHWVQREWTSMLAKQLEGRSGGVVLPLRLEMVPLPVLLKPVQAIDLFPDFDHGVRTVVGFLLGETRPAWIVQKEMQGRDLADAADNPVLRTPETKLQQRRHGYSGSTWRAWHAVMGHEPLTDSVLQKLDTRTIRRLAVRCITLDALKAFCLDTDTDRNSLGGDSLNSQILSLLELLKREGRIDEFVAWLAEEQPRCVRAGVQDYLPEALKI